MNYAPRSGLVLVAGSIPGAYLGAVLSGKIPAKRLRMGLAAAIMARSP